MLTIKRLQIIDDVLYRVLWRLAKAVAWAEARHDTLITDCSYRIMETKAKAMEKADLKILDLEDSYRELTAEYVESSQVLRDKYYAAAAALSADIEAREKELDTKLVEAAQNYVVASRDYDNTESEIVDALGVELA